MENIELISNKLRQIVHLYNRSLSKELSALPVNHHLDVLLVLTQQKEPIMQNKLAAILQIDKSRMTNIIFELEEQSLVEVKRNPEDRRQHYVTLLPDAWKYIPDIAKKVQQVNELVKTGINEEKLDTFFEVSELIRQNLVRIETKDLKNH